MIVFPQGGVLKMSTGVSAGQVMVLTNLKSQQHAICRVVKVRAYGKTQSYVEVEFTSPQPGYWGVYFPTDGPEVARMAPAEEPAVAPASAPAAAAGETPAEPAAAPLAAPAAVAKASAPELSATPAASAVSPAVNQPRPAAQEEVPKPAIVPPSVAKPKLPESTFASIGTREDVLPSASVTKVPRESSFVSSAKLAASTDREISDAIDALIVPSPSAARPALKPELGDRGPSASNTGGNVATGRNANAHGSLNSASEQGLPTPKQMFGVALDSASRVSEKSSERKGGKAPIFIGVAAVLAVAIGGAYYYLHMRPAARPFASQTVAAAPAVQPAIAQNTATQSAAAQEPAPNAGVATQQVSDQAPDQATGAVQRAAVPPVNVAASESKPESNLHATESRERTRETESLAPRRERAASVAASEPSAPAQSAPNVAIPSTFGALNTRPVVKNQSASVGAAPALEPSGSPAPEGALSGIAAPPPPPPKLAAPPKPVSNAPVLVGGKILPPKLVSSVLPVYPALAQQAGVTGTVVIDTTINKEGRVEKMKVVSGPVLLRDAALNALRQWRYAPSQLNGEPTSVQMIVSIQFNR